MPLQPSVPGAEQYTQSRCDDRCDGTQRRAELKCDAVTDNGFGVAIGRHGALVTPSAHAHHRGSLVDTASPIQFALSTVSDSAPRSIDMVIDGRTSSLMPSGVTTRAHT